MWRAKSVLETYPPRRSRNIRETNANTVEVRTARETKIGWTVDQGRLQRTVVEDEEDRSVD